MLASGPRHVTTETRSVAQCTCCKDKCSHDFKIEKKPHYTTPPIWRDAAEACLNSCNDNTYCKIKSPILLPKWTTGSGVVVGATQRKQHHKKVAIIGSGPVGLLIAYNLITKPEFFNPTPEKLSITIYERSNDIPMKTFNTWIRPDSVFMPRFDNVLEMPDSPEKFGTGDDNLANLDLIDTERFKKKSKEEQKRLRNFLNRRQVFYIKKKQFNQFDKLIRKLVRQVACGHATEPDKFGLLKCLQPSTDIEDYSIEIRILQLILMKAINIALKENAERKKHFIYGTADTVLSGLRRHLGVDLHARTKNLRAILMAFIKINCSMRISIE